MNESSFPIETSAPSGVRVVTCKKAQREFETAAIFKGRLLNLLLAADPVHAGRQHRLLVEWWGEASPGNLLDESQDAPFAPTALARAAG